MEYSGHVGPGQGQSARPLSHLLPGVKGGIEREGVQGERATSAWVEWQGKARVSGWRAGPPAPGSFPPGRAGGSPTAAGAAPRDTLESETNNIDRLTKHSLPLAKLTNLSSESKGGKDFVDNRKCIQSMYYCLFLTFKKSLDISLYIKIIKIKETKTKLQK